MKQYVKERLSASDLQTSVANLMNDLFSPAYMDIDYQFDGNYLPTEVFKKGKANCMSLTLLSYVLSKEAGIKTRFMDIETTENWNVGESFTFSNGHVNLEVANYTDINTIDSNKQSSTIDFLPMLSSKVKSKSPLTKKQIIALYYNNKGAEALAEHNTPLAYQYFKAATKLAPNAAKIWGNLATVYSRDGHLLSAEIIYKTAIAIAPNNRTLKENLAMLYRKTGRFNEADVLYNKVNKERLTNPFYYAMQAEEALNKAQPYEAIQLFHKAMLMHRKEHSFYFGLARSYLKLGEYEQAQTYLTKAKKVTKDPRLQQKYFSKSTALTRLRNNHY